MKIGLLKEEKMPEDKRVGLTPTQCTMLVERYPFIEFLVKSSDNRCFSDDMYTAEGIKVVNELSDCDVLLGIKEVPIPSLIPNKTYFFFSHTIKGQTYNRDLLLKMMELNISMVDYEVLKDKQGRRLLGFGTYAGVVGAYNSFLSYGLKSGNYKLKPAHKCDNRVEMENELDKIKLTNEKIVITGKGRAGKGVIELMKLANIKEVSKSDFLYQSFNEAVFLHLNTMDYNERKDGNPSDKNEFYNNPKLYKSSFMDFAKHANIFIAAHYYSTDSPFLFTREDAKHPDFNLKVIADISCDINGPVASTIRSSTVTNPIYGYNPQTEQEDDYMKNDVIAVMAVDNLPCELPKDASEYFGNELLEHILPLIVKGDKDKIIENATICKNGDLTPQFDYLRNFVNES
ncbi:NAD(P)-dependent oxidoreductase [Flavobacteriales bacterium]|nr:NAD(P)-dependent oxidoreductase [Flavobacteriales bacterium]